jgi:hypothetical protein
MRPGSEFVTPILTPEEQGASHSADEALATLAEMPPGIGFGAIVHQTGGGFCLSVISTAPKPLCPAYLMVAYDIEYNVVPEVDTYVGYPEFEDFAECVRRAPLVNPKRGWVRLDVLATLWIRLLQVELEDGTIEAVEADIGGSGQRAAGSNGGSR